MSLPKLLQHFGVRPLDPHKKIWRLPTGILPLDAAMGGGMPRGGIVEFWGEPSNGKSETTMITIGNRVAAGDEVLYLDFESSWDADWAGNFIDLDAPNFHLIGREMDTRAENVLEMITILAKRDVYDLIALDSKDGLVFTPEIEGEIGDRNMGVRSFGLTGFIRELSQIICNSKMVFLFVSQVRANYGNTYQPLTTAGGKAMDHFGAIQVKLNAPAKIMEGPPKNQVQVGWLFQGNIEKNKTYKKGQPFKFPVRDFLTLEGEITTQYDAASDIIDFGEKAGLFLNASGEVYKGAGNIHWRELDLGTSNAAKEKLRGDPGLQLAIETAIRQHYGWRYTQE